MTNFEKLLQVLSAAGVEFVVVGGVAAFAHGAGRLTQDLDVVYRRSPENLDRLVAALAPYKPYPRGAPEGLPFRWDRKTVEFGTNFTLRTELGYIDLLGEITAGGTFDELEKHAIRVAVHGSSCLCLELDELIRVKKAVGRAKDLEAIAELELIRKRRPI